MPDSSPTATLAKRELHNHTITHPENRLRVFALGERGPNGDNHAYVIEHAEHEQHPMIGDITNWANTIPDDESSSVILFHQGSPKEAFNGFTLEALIAICYDRLNGCQAGPFASEHNAQAMIHLNYALEHLHDRTRESLAAAEQAKEATDEQN